MIFVKTPFNCLLLIAVLLGNALQAVAGVHPDYESEERIQAAAYEFLKAELDSQNYHSYDLELGRMDPRLRLRKCDAALEAFTIGNQSALGATTVGVSCNGSQPWKLYLQARISAYRNILVAMHPIQRGQKLSDGDLKEVLMDIASLHSGYYSSKEQAIGKIARRTILDNEVIRPNQLLREKFVKRGQQVVIYATVNNILVRMQGKALNDASKGELVRVENLTSKRIVEGYAQEPGIVEVAM